MAATVGELVVNLTARTAQFNKNLRGAAREGDTFARRMQAVRTHVMAMGAALIGVVSVGRIAAWFREGAAEIDRMAKVSRKLGLAVEELNALRHAADLAGIASTTLDMALQRMTRRMGEAAVGTGEAQAAIKELGLDAKKLAVAGPYQALLQIADALEAVENPAHRLRLAFKLFDSEGAELVNMLDEGSEALERIKQRMDALGGVTTLGAKNVERFNDALTESGMIFTQGGRNRLIEAMAGLAREGEGVFREWAAGRGPSPFGPQALLNMLQGKQLTRDMLEMKREEARIEEKRRQTLEAQGEAMRAQIRAAGQGLIPEVGVAELTVQEQKIAAWRKEAEAAGVAAEKIRATVRAYWEAIDANQKWDEAIRKRQEAEDQRIADLKAQTNLARMLIGQQLAGTDGAFALPGAAGKGSAAAYSIIARHLTPATEKKTEQEILTTVREQLRVQRRTEDKIDELVQQLDLDTAEIF